MSKRSDNASIKDLVDPLRIIVESVTDCNKSGNNTFKEIKATARHFFNGISESIFNDKKLTDYRQFFSEIGMIDKKLATLTGDSDSSKLDTLIAVEKTSALISTGILKTTLEIRALLNTLLHTNGLVMKSSGYGDRLFESAVHAKAAYDLSRLFNLSAKKSQTVALLVGGASLANSMQSGSGSTSDKLGKTLNDLSGVEAALTLIKMIPNPYIKAASYLVLAGITLDRLFERYFPEERKATIAFVQKENVRVLEKEIEENDRTMEKWRAVGDFFVESKNKLLNFKESQSTRLADQAIEESERDRAKWQTVGDFLAEIKNNLRNFKERESLRQVDKVIEENDRKIKKWQAVIDFFSHIGSSDIQPPTHRYFTSGLYSNSYNFSHTPNIVINVAAGSSQEITDSVKNGINAGSLALERKAIQIINGGAS